MNQADYDVAKQMQKYADWLSKPENAQTENVCPIAMKAEAARQSERADAISAGNDPDAAAASGSDGQVVSITFASDVLRAAK